MTSRQLGCCLVPLASRAQECISQSPGQSPLGAVTCGVVPVRCMVYCNSARGFFGEPSQYTCGQDVCRQRCFTSCLCLGGLCGLSTGMCRELGRRVTVPLAARSPRPQRAPGRLRRRSSWCAMGVCQAESALISRIARGRCDGTEAFLWVGR